MEPEEGAWPCEREVLAKEARPEVGFALDPQPGKKEWPEREYPAEVVRPEKVRPVEGTGSEKRERPVKKVCPEKMDSVEGSWPGEREGLAKLVRPGKVEPVEATGPEREWPEKGTWREVGSALRAWPAKKEEPAEGTLLEEGPA